MKSVLILSESEISESPELQESFFTVTNTTLSAPTNIVYVFQSSNAIVEALKLKLPGFHCTEQVTLQTKGCGSVSRFSGFWDVTTETLTFNATSGAPQVQCRPIHDAKSLQLETIVPHQQLL